MALVGVDLRLWVHGQVCHTRQTPGK
jgi:hypothetical protein